VSLVVFGFVERRAPEPILPLHLFANRNFALINGVGFLLGFAMFGAMNFLPLFQQTVQGASATNSGLLLLPLMFGMLVVSLVTGRIITRTGRYRIFPILGGIAMVAGMGLLTTIDAQTTKTQLAAYMVVLGVGMGFLMQTSMLIAQNSVAQKDLGAGSGAATFFRSIGGSIGIAMFGAVFVHRLASSAAGQVLAGGGDSRAGVNPTMLQQLPAPIRDTVMTGLANSIAYVFLWAALVVVVVPVLAWFIKEVPLRASIERPGEPAPGERTRSDEAETALANTPTPAP
jgi:MFS family permease